MNAPSKSQTVAVVTGGGRGIGAAFAKQLAAAGYRVLVTDLDGAAARATADSLGGGCEGMAQDVREVESHDRVAERAAQMGTLRVWINNAGVLFAGNTWEHGTHEVELSIQVNVLGVVAGSNAAVRAMGRGGGSIVNVASMAAFGPVPGLAVYAATKAAVLNFTTSLHGDLAYAGMPIDVHALCPDVVNTPMVADVSRNAGAAILFASGKQMSADEVAKAGIELLTSQKLVRALPWDSFVVTRVCGLLPRLGVRLANSSRKAGERRQHSGSPMH